MSLATVSTKKDSVPKQRLKSCRVVTGRFQCAATAFVSLTLETYQRRNKEFIA